MMMIVMMLMIVMIRYNLVRGGPYSPPGETMYSSTVFTYQHIEAPTHLGRQSHLQWGTPGGHSGGRLGWAGGAVVEEKVGGGEVARGGKDSLGTCPFIPDHTLAQLTVKELNKRVRFSLVFSSWVAGGHLLSCVMPRCRTSPGKRS